VVIEDDFRIWPFVANVSFYLIIFLALNALLKILKLRRQDSKG
jgi:hypothetical protein